MRRFYGQRDASMLRQIERKTGTPMRRIGAPQPADIMRASLKLCIKKLNTVHDDVLPFFMDGARELLET